MSKPLWLEEFLTIVSDGVHQIATDSEEQIELSREVLYKYISLFDDDANDACHKSCQTITVHDVKFEFPAVLEHDADAVKMDLMNAMFSLLSDEYEDYQRQQKSRQNHCALDFVSRELKPFVYQLKNKESALLLEQRPIQKPDDLGNTVWDGALLLATYLQDNVSLVDKTVLELGSGTGLCGLVAAAMQAKSVVVTDMDAMFSLLQCNVEKNQRLIAESQSSVRAAVLDWLAEPLPCLVADDGASNRQTFDVVLAADCIYVHSPLAALVRCLQRYADESSVVLVTCEEHEPTSLQKFLKLAQECFDLDHLVDKQGNQRVHLFQLKKKSVECANAK